MTIGVTDDSIVEDTETFTVRLDTGEPDVTLQPDIGQVFITDNDGE